MEVKYPLIIITLPIVVIICLLLIKKKNENFKVGSKIANTEYLKNSKYYKIIVKRYNFIKVTTTILFLISKII